MDCIWQASVNEDFPVMPRAFHNCLEPESSAMQVQVFNSIVSNNEGDY